MIALTASVFFPTAADFRRWLAANHTTAPELLVGFCKKGSGKPSIDWPQARDQALCFGWTRARRLATLIECGVAGENPRLRHWATEILTGNVGLRLPPRARLFVIREIRL